MAQQTREVLTANGEPVTVVTDPARPCWIRVELEAMAMEWTTDTDASTEEDLAELKAREVDARSALWDEVSKAKLTQSVRQALAVSYALHHSTTVTHAWDMLGLEYSLEDVDATEGHRLAQDVALARETAWGLLAAQLRAHRWVRHGDTLGAAQDAAATRVLDLETAEVWEVAPQTVIRQATSEEVERGTPLEVTEERWAWTDCNGVPLTDEEAAARRGQWWCQTGGSDQLPWDPWEMERVQMV